MAKLRKLNQRAVLREQIARILHDANTGKIVPDSSDPTKYSAMAEALIEAGFRVSDSWEYGITRPSWFKDGYATELRSLEEAQSLVGLSADDDHIIVRRPRAGAWEELKLDDAP